MTKVYVDSASIHGAAAAFDYHSSKEWHTWAYKSVMTVTSLMLYHPILYIAPGFEIEDRIKDRADNLYDFTHMRLASVCKSGSKEFSEAFKLARLRNSAISNLSGWVESDVKRAQRAVDVARHSESYEQWLDWAVQNAWEGDSRRLNGLFNFEIIQVLASVLNCDKDDLYKVWQKSRDSKQIRQWKKIKRGEDFELASEAYVASAVFRGRYHEYLARKMKWQLTHHPIRRGALDQDSGAVSLTFQFPKSAMLFTNILINAAMSESTSRGRIELWIKNAQLAKAQPAIMSPLYEPEENEDIALRTAVKTAKRLKLVVYPNWVKRVDTGLALVAGLITSFVLTNWAAFSLSAAAVMLASPATKTAQAITSRESYLQHLASSSPGRIIEMWEGGNAL